LVSSLITQFIPWLISQWYSFNVWIASNLPAFLGTAVTTALGLAYSYFFEFMPTVIGMFANLGWWLLQNVPYFIFSAFASAFVLVLNLGKEFLVSIGTFFYDVGKGIGEAIWKGLKSVWNTIVDWWNSVISSLGLGELEAKVTTLQASQNMQVSGTGASDFFANDIGTQLANVTAQKEAITRQNIANNTSVQNNGIQNVILDINLGDEKITRVVNMRNAIDESRK
jgi:hypothetical protein